MFNPPSTPPPPPPATLFQNIALQPLQCHNQMLIFNFSKDVANMIRHSEEIIDSAPNVDRRAVEQSIGQLEGVRIAFDNLQDPNMTPQNHGILLNAVNQTINRLQELVEDPTSAPINVGPPTVNTGQGGRPAYVLDLEHLIHSQDLGNTWEEIAHAISVSRQTIYQLDIALHTAPYQMITWMKWLHLFPRSILMSAISEVIKNAEG